MTGVLLVALGAAIGAPARYLVDRAVQARLGGRFPWGTLTVNVVGSLILGVLVGAAGDFPSALATALGTGFCGALTTYSTFGFETVALARRGELARSAAYAVGSVVAGLVAAAAGYALGSLV